MCVSDRIYGHVATGDAVDLVVREKAGERVRVGRESTTGEDVDLGHRGRLRHDLAGRLRDVGGRVR